MGDLSLALSGHLAHCLAVVLMDFPSRSFVILPPSPFPLAASCQACPAERERARARKRESIFIVPLILTVRWSLAWELDSWCRLFFPPVAVHGYLISLAGSLFPLHHRMWSLVHLAASGRQLLARVSFRCGFWLLGRSKGRPGTGTE